MRPTLFVKTIYMHLCDTTLQVTQLYIPVQTNLISSLQQALQSLQVDFTQEYFWAIFGMLAGGGGGNQKGVGETPASNKGIQTEAKPCFGCWPKKLCHSL